MKKLNKIIFILGWIFLSNMHLLNLVYSEPSDNQISKQETIDQTEPVQNIETSQESQTEDKPSFDIGPEEPMFSSDDEIWDPFSETSFNNVLSNIQTDLFTGKATLRIPINVPTGRKGIQPNLELIYQSGGPNAWCGLGWNLNIGSVSRSIKKEPPKYDNTDTFLFSLNGITEELTHLGNNEYRPKLESSFMRFQYVSDYWLVTDKMGTKYFFGQTADSRQQKDQNNIYSWHLDKVIDVHTNNMLINYTIDQNEIYPQTIVYTANEYNSKTHNYTINFSLEDRSDKRINYKSGLKTVTSKRLKTIEIKYNTEIFRTYQFTYKELTSFLIVSLLDSITVSGLNSETLPPINFEYGNLQNEFNSIQQWQGVDGPNLTDEVWMGIRYGISRVGVDIFDINGDGLPDRIRSGDNAYDSDFTRWHVQLNNGAGFSPQILWTGITSPSLTSEYWMSLRSSDSKCRVEIFDINADGLPDRIRSGDNAFDTDFTKWHVQLNNGLGFDAPIEWPGISSPYLTDEVWMGIRYRSSHIPIDSFDINADGLPDRIQSGSNSYTSDFTKWHVQLNNGAGFDPPIDWPGVDSPSTTSEYWMSIRSGGTKTKVDVFDINGDGLPDRIRSGDDAFDTDFTKWHVQLNNGAGFDPPIEWSGVESPNMTDETIMGIRYVSDHVSLDMFDINGDGLPDRIRSGDNAYDSDFTKWHVQLNNGSGFNPPIEWNDVNSPSPTSEYWMSIRSGDPKVRVDIFDINGDGLADRIRSGDDAFDTDFSRWSIQFNKNFTQPYLLREISNGIGGKTSIFYKPFKGADNTNSTKKSKLPFPVWVVDTVSSSDSVSGDSNTITYNYDSGIFDFDEREFRGFGYVKVTDKDGSYNETWFHQDDVYKGKIYKQQVSDNDGTVYTKTETTWQSESLYDDKVKFPYQAQVDSYSYK